MDQAGATMTGFEGRGGAGHRAPDGVDLGIAFAAIWKEVCGQTQAAFRVVLEGRPRALGGMIRHDIVRIAREALLNVSRHSEANRVEVKVQYAAKGLRITVCDDGRGMPAEMFWPDSQRPSGLSWMRHSAERIGATLRLFSRNAAGTEVELSVPSHVAFGLPTALGRFSWLYLRG